MLWGVLRVDRTLSCEGALPIEVAFMLITRVVRYPVCFQILYIRLELAI